MLLKNIAVLMFIVGQVAVHACMGPENVFGIHFNNGESIDVHVIENLGKEDINYYKNEQNGSLQYSFRSHYNPSIMIEILISTDYGVLRFTVDTSTVPIAGFPFGVCVSTELDWLVNAGILEIERIKRERIGQTFQKGTQQVYPAASYFWTMQDSLLPNNAVFELTESGDFIVLQANCGEVAFAVADLPPEMLDISHSGVVIKETKTFLKGSIATDPVPSTILDVDLYGRMYRIGKPGLKSNRSCVLVGFNRRSCAVSKRIMLP